MSVPAGSAPASEELAIGFEDVQAAAARLAGVAHRTPVLTSRTLDRMTGSQVFLKAESFQRGGAFKFRGAYNAIAALDAETRERGVVSFSSGNHAQAVALAAQLHGVPATLVMPEDAPPAKLAATRGYGAEVIIYDRYREDREAIGKRVTEERGRTLIPPYDHPHVMAGAGTAALELVEEVGALDLLLVCTGGGGLLAGSAVATKALSPGTSVIAVEPAAGDDWKRSFEAGQRVRLEAIPRTIADGQQTQAPGLLTFPIAQRLVDGAVVVTDEEILAAMAFLFERLRIVVEPSGASALAALLAGKVEAGGKRVGVTLSGGNVGLAQFCTLLGAWPSGTSA